MSSTFLLNAHHNFSVTLLTALLSLSLHASFILTHGPVKTQKSRGPLEASSSSARRSPPRAPPAPRPLPAAPQPPTPQGGGAPNWQAGRGGSGSWPAQQPQHQPPPLGRPISHPQMLQHPASTPHGARADEFMRAEAATAMRMVSVGSRISFDLIQVSR